jgi:hypothetical protein
MTNSLEPRPPASPGWSKPARITLAAAAAMTASSYIRWAVTGSIKVEQNYLSGWPMVLNMVLFLGALAAAGYAYVKAVLRSPGYDLDLRQVKRLAVATALVTFFMMPMLSNDIFSGLAYGDLVLRGINPYTQAGMLKTTLYASYLGRAWIDAPCVYGPVNVLLEAASAWAGSGSVLAGVAIIKLMTLGFALLFIWTAGRFFETADPDRKSNTAALVLLAPIFWVMGSGQAHNDIVAAALLMTSLLLMKKKHFVAAFVLLTLAVQAKVFAAIAVPLFIVLAWSALRADKKRLILTLGASLGLAAVCSAALYAPLWDGAKTLSTPAKFLEQKHATKSIPRVAATAAEFVNTVVHRRLALPSVPPADQRSALEKETVSLMKILSLLLALYVLVRLRRFRAFNDYLAGFAALATIVVCFYSPAFQPWYLVGALPLFAGVERKEWVTWAAAIFAAASAMNVLHIAGDSNVPARILSAVFIAGTNGLFFWRFRARFLR